jgi:curved DNA-binding protein CbpA
MGDIHATDHYCTLGVSSGATDAEIKARYRLLSKTYHPDMGGSQIEMAKLNSAYAVLSDKFKRATYDAERHREKGYIPVRPAAAHSASRPQRPTPTAPPHEHFTQTRPHGWWKVGWTFVAILLLIGLLTHLPIAEAMVTADTANTSQPTSSPLDVTYTPDTSPSNSSSTSSSGSTSLTTPSGTSYNAPTTSSTVSALDGTTASTWQSTANSSSGTTNVQQKNRICTYLDRHHVCALSGQAAQTCKDYCGSTQN